MRSLSLFLKYEYIYCLFFFANTEEFLKHYDLFIELYEQIENASFFPIFQKFYLNFKRNHFLYKVKNWLRIFKHEKQLIILFLPRLSKQRASLSHCPVLVYNLFFHFISFSSYFMLIIGLFYFLFFYSVIFFCLIFYFVLVYNACYFIFSFSILSHFIFFIV